MKESSITEEKLVKVRALHEIARERGETLAQMALSWIMYKEEVTGVLIGASKPEQILENVGILQSKSFSKEELARIDKIALGDSYQ